MIKIFGTFLMALLLVGCQTNPTKESDGGSIVNMQKMSDMDATDTLIKALVKEGYSVTQTDAAQFIIAYEDQKYIMEPKINQGGMSRIVVTRLFGIKKEYRDSPELFIMFVSLNRELNFAKFSMLPQNRGGQIQASITFIDEQIDTREIRLFMEWMNSSISQIKEMVPPEALHMLERLELK
jgi:hypothetical protein